VIALYPFQAEALAAIETAAAAGVRRLLLAWATGLGKTVAFAHVIERRPGRALVLAHRDELIAQAVAKLRLVMPAAAIGVVQAERDDRDAPLVVASVQTLSRRRRLDALVADFATVVVDEAHHAQAATYQRILEHVGTFAPAGPLVLGVTATPYRHDGKPLGQTFERIVHRMAILDGILGGYLCDLEGRRLRVNVDFDAVPVRGGDLDAGATETALLAGHAEHVIVEALVQHAVDRRHVLVFTPGVRLAHAVADLARHRGLPCEAVDGTTPLDERRALLARFAAGTTRVVANCGVLTEGFDEPGIDCIVMARPTKSRGLYTQMVGRGTRRHFGKTSCLVLDLVGVGHRFDLQTLPDLLVDDVPHKLGPVGKARVRTQLVQGTSLTRAIAAACAAEEIEFTETVLNLFAAGTIAWVQDDAHHFAVELGAAGRVTVLRAGATWLVRHERAAGGRDVWTGDSVEYARGVAERYVAELDDAPGYAFRGRWCAEPATEKQRALLQRHGLWNDGLTKGEASERIGRLVRTWESAG
jgi:superfamily II DNA or RNA helicase